MIKIAILGPESTGKTELARQLAEYFKAPWVPEYAREYIENLKVSYTYDDICNIAQKQIAQEKFYEKKSFDNNFVFFDTDIIITKVWFEFKYNVVPDFLTEHLKTHLFDLYLLCTPDLPWEPDSVREHGNERDFFFDWYKREIEQTMKPCVIVNGIGNERFKNAVKAIEIIK